MKATEIMIPSAIERNAGLGTSITADSEIRTVIPEKRTALPAVSMVSATASTAGRLDAEEGAAEAHDDEQRVVDAQGEGEHQGEVHRPDRDLEDLRDQEQRPGRRGQAEDREQQRQPGGHQGAEGQHQDRQRDRPADELGAHHRVAVGGVEVGPHPRRARSGSRSGRRPRGRRAGPSGRRPPGPCRIGSSAEPAMTMAVWPSAEIVAPLWGGVTDATRRVGAQDATRVRAIADAKAGSAVVRVGEWTTTISPELALPAKFALDEVARLRPTASPSPPSRPPTGRSRPAAPARPGRRRRRPRR